MLYCIINNRKSNSYPDSPFIVAENTKDNIRTKDKQMQLYNDSDVRAKLFLISI